MISRSRWLPENRYGYVQLDREPVEDAFDRFTSQT
jgi:hypothetical protein